MAWKDSGDSVMYPDGTLVRGPKALCELQGYVYDAWMRMAEIYDELDNKRRANALRKKAGALFRRFNEVFWDEKSGFYAYALDGEKKKVLSVASNVGQCLWSGIIAPERAVKVVKRLMRKDMWSGWGHPHPFGGSSFVQSVQLSDRSSVAARQLANRAGYAALRFCRRGSGGGA
jgi:glycogen debranching enzyme